MQKVHIRNIFRLFVPLQLPQGYEIVPVQKPFGFTVVNKKTRHQYDYRLELIRLADEDKDSQTLLNWGSWAKRNPIYFRTNADDNCVEGVTIRVKINYGLFDFRKVEDLLILFSIGCYIEGGIMQQGATSVVNLLPKKRQGPIDEETCIPMQWQNLQMAIANPILESLAPLPALPEENSPGSDEDVPRVDESEQSISAVHSPLQYNDFEFDHSELFTSGEDESSNDQKLPEQLVRISLSYYADGLFVQQAGTPVFELLPKKRQGAVDDEVSISVDWNDDNNSTNNTNLNSQISLESPLEADSSLEDTYPYSPANDYTIGFVAESDSTGSPELSHAVNGSFVSQVEYGSNQLSLFQGQQMALPPQPQNENYMVLYNGNAEVVGNFRALNFYKSSDINIKEDIRLLIEDHDCRDTLLKIDGVNYKFKPGVHADTNRRFVGYIAQQVESVVPEAVQLIDGILHVDYESLIPYLSESVRANYNDIQDLTSKTDRIAQALDSMYEEFVKKDKQKVSPVEQMSVSVTPPTKPRKTSVITSKLGRWTLGLLSAFAVIAAVIAVVLLTAAGAGGSPNGGLPLVELIPDSQAQALRDIYYATGGPSWIGYQNWMEEGLLPCQWNGVYCEDGVVIGLDLERFELQGQIPDSISDLKNLTRLYLGFNHVTSTIPKSFSKLQYLQELRMKGSRLIGEIPESLFESLVNLHTLDLSYNNLSYTIPSSLSNHTTLMDLNLSHNQLWGTIPDMPHLSFKSLDLSYNELEGSLPALHMFIEAINLENNQLSGSMNSLVSFLPFLHTLKVGANKFEGVLMVSEYQMLTTMKYLNVSHNSFTQFAVAAETNKVPQFKLCDASDVPFKCPLPAWMFTRCRAVCDD